MIIRHVQCGLRPPARVTVTVAAACGSRLPESGYHGPRPPALPPARPPPTREPLSGSRLSLGVRVTPAAAVNLKPESHESLSAAMGPAWQRHSLSASVRQLQYVLKINTSKLPCSGPISVFCSGDQPGPAPWLDAGPG
jgi:hypothetical protein